MGALEVPPEQSAAWAKLCRLIATRILENDGCVQTVTNEEEKGDNYVESSSPTRRR
ncbi:MAG: hypothetical protein V7641_837 [Blastocatellia bacterium]